MEDLIMDLLYDVLIVLATAGAALLVAWLKKKIGVEGLKKIEAELAAKQELAALAVAFVEQVYRDFEGEEKYTLAAEWLADRAQELGLTVTADEMKGLIEAALRAFKDEFGNSWAEATK